MNTTVVAVWLERILGHEGGFSIDPNDPGNWTEGSLGAGELRGTKYGIAANTYPSLDIRNLTQEDAAAIYIRDFLGPLQVGSYRNGIGFQMLDFAINSGPIRAAKELQQVVGTTADGVLGPITLAAVKARSESDLIMLLTAERLDFMTRLSTWEWHGKGWVRRLAQNLRYGAEDT